MIQHILFPFDFSRQVSQVIPFVRDFANLLRARVTLISIAPLVGNTPPPGSPRPDLSSAATEGQPRPERELQDRLNAVIASEFAGSRVERASGWGDPATQIVEFAHRNQVDLIMMPTHGFGLFRSLLIGSVTAKVLHDARCPVWTAGHGANQTFRASPRTILCALDGTGKNTVLAKWAAEFSGCLGANLKLLNVLSSVNDWPSLPPERALQEELRALAQARLESAAKSLGIAAPLHVAVGPVADTVAEEARRERADLVIIGRGALQGSMGRLRAHAYAIIQRSPCPVLSVESTLLLTHSTGLRYD